MKGIKYMRIVSVRSRWCLFKNYERTFDRKNDIYRYELMKPLKKKWACYSVANESRKDVMAMMSLWQSGMLGHMAPTAVDEKQKHNIELISDNALWKRCELSIQNSLNCFY